MKKSPLSTPGGHPGNFHRGRGRRRGYGFSQTRSDNDSYHRFSGSNDSQGNQYETDMIPLESSSPIFHNNRGGRRPPYDRRNQRFSNTAISGSYNNQRNTLSTSPVSSFHRNQQQQNHSRKKTDVPWHRKLPVSEFIDLKSIFDDPWKHLEERTIETKPNKIDTINVDDSSIEIISDKNDPRESSSESINDENTINVSSSLDEVKDGSSVDLQLDCMNFSKDSKDEGILSSNNSLQSGTSPQEKINDQSSLNDSVIEITH